MQGTGSIASSSVSRERRELVVSRNRDPDHGMTSPMHESCFLVESFLSREGEDRRRRAGERAAAMGWLL